MNNVFERKHAAHIKADDLTVIRSGRRILDGFSLSVPATERVGLIGGNGSGKSTLLAAISGELSPANGRIDSPETVGFLRQELDPDQRTPQQIIDDAVKPVRDLIKQFERAAVSLSQSPTGKDDYAAALAAVERADAWNLDTRIAKVIDALQLGQVMDAPSQREISGGQRRRLALAAVILRRPKCLLLDEPTNHLDANGVQFLTDELANWQGPVLFASHDRAFLDASATQLIDMDPAPSATSIRGESRIGRRYGGGYSDYLRARSAEITTWRHEYAVEQAEKTRLQHLINVDAHRIFHSTKPKSEVGMARKFEADRAAKTIGNRLQKARKRLSEIERSGIPKPPLELKFQGFQHGQQTSSFVAACDDVHVADRLAPVSFEVKARSRLLIEGVNGAGKSTLLRVIAGSLAPDGGIRSVDTSIGFLEQDDSWTDPRVSAEVAYRSRLRNPDSAPSLHELGLMSQHQATLPIGECSLGQRRRVALAALAAEPPQLLLLDEPSNHLSLALLEQLETAIQDFPGAVIIASHDKWLRERWNGERLRLVPCATAREN